MKLYEKAAKEYADNEPIHVDGESEEQEEFIRELVAMGAQEGFCAGVKWAIARLRSQEAIDFHLRADLTPHSWAAWLDLEEENGG